MPPTAEPTGTIVIGAGVCGLQACSRLARDGISDFVRATAPLQL